MEVSNNIKLKSKPFKKILKEVEEANVWDKPQAIVLTENILEQLVIAYHRAGYREMDIYRQLGLSTEQDWEWLRKIIADQSV